MISLSHWLAEENNFWNFVERSGFFPKMTLMGTLVGIAHFSVWPPGQCAFYESRFGLATPHTFSANRKKLNFAKIKNDKSVFSGISWPLTSFIFFLCAAFGNRLIALMKLFSLGRTVLAIPAKFGLAVWLIKVLKMVKTMLRMKTLVWYTDGPWWGRFRAQRPAECNETHFVAEIVLFLIRFFHRYHF